MLTCEDCGTTKGVEMIEWLDANGAKWIALCQECREWRAGIDDGHEMSRSEKRLREME